MGRRRVLEIIATEAAAAHIRPTDTTGTSRTATIVKAPKPGGRPRTTDMRRVFDACLYAVKTGCQWRQLPRDFRRTCYGYFVDWGSLINKQGIFRRLHRRLYFQARKAADRKPYPSVVIVDSQTVRTGKMGGVRGYDGGKHIKGRKRHTAVDTLGLPMAVTITAPMFMTSMVERNR